MFWEYPDFKREIQSVRSDLIFIFSLFLNIENKKMSKCYGIRELKQQK